MNQRFCFSIFVCLLFAAPAAGQTKHNVIVILADDLGFSDVGSYGGEIETPTLDQLARNGIRFRQFYSNPRCSPTRASLQTGLYSHQVNVRVLLNNGPLDRDNNVTLGEIMQQAGYNTYLSGKWHLGNQADRLPESRGYDHVYRFSNGNAHSDQYWSQDRYRLVSEEVSPLPFGADFHQTDAISDYAVAFIDHSQADDKPFFLSVNYGAPHFPLQAPTALIDKYYQMYLDQGWDNIRDRRITRMAAEGILDLTPEQVPDRGLVPRSLGSSNTHAIPAWDSIPEDRKKDVARRMAIYAAMVDQMDQGIGRIVDRLDQIGELENTVIMFMSDNGADAEWMEFGNEKLPRGTSAPILHTEDGPHRLDSMGQAGTNHMLGTGWANASAAPFRNYKHYTQEGGIRSPLIVSWPGGISEELQGTVVDDVAHVIDILPTLLDLTGQEYIKEQFDSAASENRDLLSLPGTSLLPVLHAQSLGERVIGWEHEGNRALRHGHWKVVSQNFADLDADSSKNSLQADEWALYNLETDPTELNNLAPENRRLRDQLVIEYFQWAVEANVITERKVPALYRPAPEEGAN